MRHSSALSGWVLVMLLFVGCKRADEAPRTLRVTDITPGTTQIGGSTLNTAVIGDTLTIRGEGFSSATAENGVAVQGVPARVLTASATQLRATVPAGVPYAYVQVVVTRTGYQQAVQQISVRSTPSPVVTGIRPTQGRVGSVVTIYGKHLLETLQAGQMAFTDAGGQMAAVLIRPINPLLATADSLQIRVPVGAGTGRIALYAQPVQDVANGFGSIVTPVFSVIP